MCEKERETEVGVTMNVSRLELRFGVLLKCQKEKEKIHGFFGKLVMDKIERKKEKIIKKQKMKKNKRKT